MKDLSALAFSLVVLSACPAEDDDDTGGSTGTSPTTTSPTTTVADTSDSSGGTTAPAESSSEGGEAGPPVINSISWTHADGCVMNTGSDVTVVVDVSDPDNDVSELTFAGMVIGCTGMVDAPEVTLLCPQVAPYSATVTVEDPDGGMDSLPIEILPCEDGTAMP